jgi:hypothetical protein
MVNRSEKYSSYLSERDMDILEKVCRVYNCTKSKSLGNLLEFWENNYMGEYTPTAKGFDITQNEVIIDILARLKTLEDTKPLDDITQRLEALENVPPPVKNITRGKITIEKIKALENKTYTKDELAQIFGCTPQTLLQNQLIVKCFDINIDKRPHQYNLKNLDAVTA